MRNHQSKTIAMEHSSKLLERLRTAPFNQRVGPYIVDFGRVSLGALVAFVLLTTWAETTYPGLITNWLAPGQLVGWLVVAGALALWPVTATERSGGGPAQPTAARRDRPGYRYGQRFSIAAMALGLGLIAGYWASQYFAALAEYRLWLSLISGAVVGITVWLVSSDYENRRN
jgi:hypothetical protein